MDIPRAPQRKIGRWIAGAGIALAVIGGTAGLAQLQPAPPSVEAANLWIDTVRQGPLVREIRGPGRLVPEQMRAVSPVTGGQVERVLAAPGAVVTAATPLFVLSNPEVQLRALEAQRSYTNAVAELASLEAELENRRLSQEASLAAVTASHRDALRIATANRTVAEKGLISAVDLARSEDQVQQRAEQLRIEQRRLELLPAQAQAQLNAKRSAIEGLRSLAELQRSYVEGLTVTAGAAGVLRELKVQEGGRVSAGAEVAVVVQPERLKAELRIPATQIKDVAIGQGAAIDTRNGIIRGHVSRIDPAVQNGSITVDVALDEALPPAARPDLAVDGTIEIERLAQVVYVGRPANGEGEGTVQLFRLEPDGSTARLTTVTLGRSSVNSVEVRGGLRPGDRVILSDLSELGDADRVRLK